jgi:competence protein ComEA
MNFLLNLDRVFEEHRVTLLLALTGLFLLGVGVLSAVTIAINRSKPSVEIIPVQEAEPTDTLEIVVDVAGAVEKPGLYRFPRDARVNDALVAAGGFAADADRNWVEKYINLAQSLSDGIKLYIPTVSEDLSVETLGSNIPADAGGAVIGYQTQTVNVNTASLAELDSLWGIGEKRAQAIIDNRPYGNLSELTSKAGIPKNVFERIKPQISLY